MGFIDESQLDPFSEASEGRFISESELDPEPSGLFSLDTLKQTGKALARNAGGLASMIMDYAPNPQTIGQTLGSKLIGIPTPGERLESARIAGIGDPEYSTTGQRYFGETVAAAPFGAPSPLGIALAASSGAAGEASKDVGISPLWGQIGVPLALGGLTQIPKAYRSIKALLNPNIEAKAAEIAMETLGQYTKPQSVLQMLEKEVPDQFSGYKPTAEIAQDPGMMSMQMSLERSMPEAAMRSEGMNTGRDVARMKSVIQEQGPVVSRERAGSLIKEGLEENLSSLKKEVGKQFQSVEGEVGIYPVKSAISDAIMAEKEFGIGVPSSVENFIKTFQELPNTILAQKMLSYRSKVGSMMGSLKRSPDPTDKAGYRVMSQMFKALDNVEKDVATQPAQQALAKGRALRTKQGQMYEEGAVGAILKKNAFNRYSRTDSKVQNKAFSGPEEARQVVEGLAGQDRSKEAMRSALIESLKTRSTNAKGAFTQRLVTNWRNLQPVANEVLEKTQIQAVDKVTKDLMSQANIRDRAFLASKGQSATAQNQSMTNLLTDAISTGINKKLGIFGRVIKAIGGDKAFEIEAKSKQILIEMAFDKKFAKDFLSKNISEQRLKEVGGEMFRRMGVSPAVVQETVLKPSRSDSEIPQDFIEDAIREAEKRLTDKPKAPQVISFKRIEPSDNGIKLVKQFEGKRLKSYEDEGGVKTIGYGHTGESTKKGRITDEEAESLLREDLKNASTIIKKVVKVSLSQSQIDALTSLVYNIGASAFEKSTLLKKLNAGDIEGAAEEFNKWIHVKGKTSAGLQKRRQAEKNLFLEA